MSRRTLMPPVPEPGSRKRASDKVDDNWTPPKDYVSAPAHTTSTPGPAPPSFKFIHDAFLQQIVGRAVSRVFRPQWVGGGGDKLGTRVADHYDAQTDTIYEINTTPWENMTEEKLRAKLDQVAADFELTHSDPGNNEAHVSNVVWVGDHPLPQDGRGGQLRQALEQAGITYLVVDRTPVAGH